jgi:hypothetical protein
MQEAGFIAKVAHGRERMRRAARHVQTRWAELVVALLFVIAGAVRHRSTATGSASRGGDDGPKAGYFPNYHRLISSARRRVVAVQTVLQVARERDDVFVTWDELKPVLTVLMPTILYVVLICDDRPSTSASAIYITGRS